MALKIFLIACEASGDRLGAKLMAAIRKQKKNVIFAGMGGPQMRKEGLKSFSDMCGVIGFLEIILKFFQFYSLLKLVVDKAIKFQPDLVISIDSWDFCSRVTKRLKAKLSQAKFIHYVSPSVWLYRQGRIKEVKELYDLLLVTFPFETKFYEKIGMPCKFIGHPMVEDFDFKLLDPRLRGDDKLKWQALPKNGNFIPKEVQDACFDLNSERAPKLRAEGVAGTQKYVSTRIHEKAKMCILKSEGYSWNDKYAAPSSRLQHSFFHKQLPFNLSFPRKRESSVYLKNIKCLGVMVGSRPAEVKRLLPIFIAAVEKFLSTQKEKFLVIFPAINAKTAKLVQSTPTTFDKLVIDASKLRDKERASLFKSFHLALAKSGTTTLELTLAGVPMVVAYKIDGFSMFIAKYIFQLHKKTKYICMTNILLNKAVVPEFVQENCEPNKIAQALQALMNSKTRKAMLLKYRTIASMLSNDKQKPPSTLAAEQILKKNY